MADPRRERIARNESAFRSLNDSLESNVHRGRAADDFAGFVCECGDAECEDIVRLSLSDYASIRAEPRQFVVVAGHEIEDTEDVVGGGEGYNIVRKHEDVADIADRTHPATGPDPGY